MKNQIECSVLVQTIFVVVFHFQLRIMFHTFKVWRFAKVHFQVSNICNIFQKNNNVI